MNRITQYALSILLSTPLLVLLTACSLGTLFGGQTKGSNPAATMGTVTPTSTAQSAIPVPAPTPTLSVQPNPASNSSGNGQTGSTSEQIQAANAVFNQINAARIQAGLPALQWSNMLVNSSHKHNLAMIAGNQLSHQLPNEPQLGTRISQAGVNWTFAAENIGESSDYLHPTNAATSLDQDMLNEKPPDDGHRQNILSNANIIGIEVLVDTQNQKSG